MAENETRPPDDQVAEATSPPASTTPQLPPPPRRTAQPDEVRAALLAAAQLDWTSIDLDVPRQGFVCSVGATVEKATATIRCDCGALCAVTLDGESRARCPSCKAIFRHVLLVQREDQTPSTAALLIDGILEEAGLR